VARASIVLRALLRDHRLGHAWNDCARIGVKERRTHQRVGRGHGAIARVFFQTQGAMKRCGGNIAGASEGSQVMALDTDPLLEGIATLKVTKSPCKRRSQVRGLARIASLAPRRLTRDPPDAADAVPVVRSPCLLTGEQRGGCEGE
jgi:hypothetical protein